MNHIILINQFIMLQIQTIKQKLFLHLRVIVFYLFVILIFYLMFNLHLF